MRILKVNDEDWLEAYAQMNQPGSNVDAIVAEDGEITKALPEALKVKLLKRYRL